MLLFSEREMEMRLLGERSGDNERRRKSVQ